MNTSISKSPLLTWLLLHSCAYACVSMPGDLLLEEGGDVLSPWTLIATGTAVRGSKISFKILNRTGIPRLRQNTTGFCKEIIIGGFITLSPSIPEEIKSLVLSGPPHNSTV